MAETGKMACWMGLGKGFEIREYPVPGPGAGRRRHQGVDRERLRLGHALLEGRAGLRQNGPPAAPEHRPRAHGHGPQARGRRHHRHGRPAAPGRRPGRLSVFQPVRPLQDVPEAQLHVLPHPPGELAGLVRGVAVLPGRLRPVFLPAPEPRHLQAARRDLGRDGGRHQLRLHPGLRRARHRRDARPATTS